MSGRTGARWNYADVWEAAARRFPDAPAIVSEQGTLAWSTFERRADALAGGLLAAGVQHQECVAQLQRNSPEYVEVLFACFKASLAPVNTNYRYGPDELEHLWRDCDARVVVFDAEFAPGVAEVRERLPGVRRWLCRGPAGTCPPWATPYEQLVAERHRCDPPWPRSGDDLYILYTGGTTGYPRGVLWPQHVLFQMLEDARATPVAADPDVAAFVGALDRPGPTVLPAAPLMHGTACWFALPVLSRAGCLVLLPGRSFDPEALLDAVDRHRVKGLCIVGEAFAQPLLRAVDASPSRWSLDSLRLLLSSGAALSARSTARLLRCFPSVQVVDGLGSSETGVSASTVSRSGDAAKPDFVPTDRTRVLDPDDRDVEPGSGTVGRLVVGGHLPLGYLGDPEKTRATFVEFDGERYAITGDNATVTAEGRIVLLGRGSSCINTGGEKVFPEEVEDVLRSLAGVADVGVVGVPDERLGESVTAVVLCDAGSGLDADDLVRHVKERLAGHKVPRRVVLVAEFPRGPNGKLDRTRLRELALAELEPAVEEGVR